MKFTRILFLGALLGLSTFGHTLMAQEGLNYLNGWGLYSTGDIPNADFAIDSEGNTIVAGTFRDSLDVDTHPTNEHWLLPQSTSNLFVAKYNTTGQLLWSFAIGRIYQTDHIAIDTKDNIIITGRYSGENLDLDPSDSIYNLSGSRGGHYMVIANYSKDGNIIWGHDYNSYIYDVVTGLTTDKKNKVHALILEGHRDKLGNYLIVDENGISTDMQLFNNAMYNGPSDIHVDKEGNTLITGWYTGNESAPILPGETNGKNGYIMKLDSLHELIWIKRLILTSIAKKGVLRDPENNILVFADGIDARYHLFKLNEDGTTLREIELPFVLYDVTNSPIIDPQGNIIITGNVFGYTNNTVDFDPGPKKQEHTFSSVYETSVHMFNPYGGYKWSTFVSPISRWAATKALLTSNGNLKLLFIDDTNIVNPSMGTDPLFSETVFESSMAEYTMPPEPFDKPNYSDTVNYTMGQHPIGLCEQTEVGSTFWLPIVAQDSLPEDVVGLDFCIQYDPDWVVPTGKRRLGETIIQASPNMTSFSEVDEANHTLHLSIYMGNGNTAGCATPNCAIEGSGTLAFVEFQTVDTLSGREVLAYPCGVLEGKSTQAVPQPMGIALHPYALSLEGTLKHWKNDSLLAYNAAAPTGQLPTTIWPTNAGGQPVEAGSLPDDQGRFELRSQHPAFTVTRDIPETWGDSLCGDAIGDFVNGQDILYVRNCITYREGYDFSPFQLLAMDVNMDGRVAANDASLIMHRFLGVRCEFPQQWNYLQGGNSAPTAPSHDWLFVDDLTAASHPGWQPSATWPKDDGVGYSTARVPHLPHPLSTDPSADLCGERTIYGILLGDADGNWGPEAAMGHVRMAQHGTANARLLIDTRAAALTLPDGSGAADGFVYVPVQVMGLEGNLTAVDLSLPNGQSGGRVAEVVQTSYFNEAYDYGVSPEHLGFRLTSWAATRYGAPAPTEAVMYLKLPNVPGKPLIDAATAKAWVNGERVAIEGLETLWDMPENTLNAYPNPSTGEVMLYTEAMELEKGLITIADLSGRILQQATVSLLRGQTSVDLTGLPTGSYFITLTGEDGNRYHTRVIVSD